MTCNIVMPRPAVEGAFDMPDNDNRPAPKAPDIEIKRLSTKDLFAGGHTEIRIDHEGLEYRLRITKQNRLILYR
jgi:hemin uptake protein HemP